MSLYNRLFGENEDATALLGMVSVTRNDFQRYRDVHLNKEGTEIIVTTRLGGGNRNYYRQVFTNMKKNENYIKDEDDKFDNTYCYFRFKVPEKYADTCKKIAPKEDQPSVGEMFKREIEESKKPGTAAAKRMEALASAIFDSMESGDQFIEL